MADDVMMILGRLEGKMDGFLAQLNQHNEAIKVMDKRLDGFDRDKSRIIGVVSGVSAVIGITGAWIAKKVGIV